MTKKFSSFFFFFGTHTLVRISTRSRSVRTVCFFRFPPLLFRYPVIYYIMKLGEIQRNTLYKWRACTDPFWLYFFFFFPCLLLYYSMLERRIRTKGEEEKECFFSLVEILSLLALAGCTYVLYVVYV